MQRIINLTPPAIAAPLIAVDRPDLFKPFGARELLALVQESAGNSPLPEDRK